MGIEDFTINTKYKDMTISIKVPHYQSRESTRVIHSCDIFNNCHEQIAQFSTLADAIQWIVDDEIGKLKATLFSPGEPPHLANLYRVTSRQSWELLDSNNG